MSNWLPVALHAPWWLLLLPLPWLLWAGPGLSRMPKQFLSFPRRRGSRNAGGSTAGSHWIPASAGMTPRDSAELSQQPFNAQRDKRFTKFADPHLLKWLLVGPAHTAGSPLARLAWLLIVIAASGPYLPQASDNTRRFGMDIAVVIDISPSMAADDVEPTRLKRAALELRDFIRRLGDDRAALIVYSAYAYRILPLTHDLELLNYYADTLDPDLTRRHGSNLAQALEYAGQALGNDRTRGRAVVVLSDGETDDRAGALAAADRLKARGTPIYALGIGTDAGAPVPGANGFLRTADGLVISHLDRALLAELAQRSGGDYTDARLDDRDWDRLIKGLEPLRRSTVLPPQARTGYPLFPWLLAAAFALLLWSGVRRRPAAVPLCLLVVAGAVSPHSGHAAPWQEQAAYDALTQGEHNVAATRYQALDNYKGWLGRGAAYYRQQRWEQALAAFATAAQRASGDGERATALYNQGTTLARLGRYAEAERTLEHSLQLQPNHARAQLNLNLIKRAGTNPPPPRITAKRPSDTAEDIIGDPQAANLRADANTSPANTRAPQQTAGTAQESVEAQIIRSISGLSALHDHPDEILRHRFMVQDTEHPLVAEGQSW